MFISNCKIFNVPSSGGGYGLEEEEVSGRIVHFVNERVGAEAIIVIISVSESKKHTSIDSELFNGVGCFGWQILMFFEAVQITGTIFGDTKNTCLEIEGKINTKLMMKHGYYNEIAFSGKNMLYHVLSYQFYFPFSYKVKLILRGSEIYDNNGISSM